MKMIKDSMSQDVTIKRILPGHYDANQQRVEPGSVLIASVVNASIQPLSGNEIISASKQDYKSTHQGFLGTDDTTFEPGYNDLEAGDILYDENLQPFKIVFPGLYKGSHYQPYLDKMKV
jgi:hypothetical protein